jgi:hypothetical protein
VSDVEVGMSTHGTELWTRDKFRSLKNLKNVGVPSGAVVVM